MMVASHSSAAGGAPLVIYLLSQASLVASESAFLHAPAVETPIRTTYCLRRRHHSFHALDQWNYSAESNVFFPSSHYRHGCRGLTSRSSGIFVAMHQGFNNLDLGGGGDHDNNNARTSTPSIKSFLTQRPVQSLLFLLHECGDVPTANWIERDFLSTSNQIKYHGTAASSYLVDRFGGRWEDIFVEMMQMPRTIVEVPNRRNGRGQFRGGSKNNPYIRNEEEDDTYTVNIEIDPLGVTRRLLEVREQIAREVGEDLDVVVATDEILLSEYFAKRSRDIDVDVGGDEECVGNASCVDEPSFERTTAKMLNDKLSFNPIPSSPLRKGTFDLLYNLCTQTATHRLLRQLMVAGSEREASLKWLRDFYIDRISSYFGGDVRYGRADDFLEEWLRLPPVLVRPDPGRWYDGEGVGFVDPVGLAEEMIRIRSEVAIEWKKDMRTVAVDDHTDLRRLLLEGRRSETIVAEELDIEEDIEMEGFQ